MNSYKMRSAPVSGDTGAYYEKNYLLEHEFSKQLFLNVINTITQDYEQNMNK